MPDQRNAKLTPPFEYDVAISFAGEDRETARRLAEELRLYRLKVFFDEHEPDLLGKSLITELRLVFSEKSMFGLVLISEHYISKEWASKVELPAMQGRIFSDSKEYILPVLIDDTRIPGLDESVAHVDLRLMEIEEAARRIAIKVLKRHYSESNWRNWLVPVQKQTLSLIRNVSRSDLASLFCERMYNSATGEITCVAISAIKLLGDRQFITAIQMLLEKMSDRPATFRFYVLDTKSPAVERFAQLSLEPVERLTQKYERSYSILKNLITPATKNRIRIKFCSYPNLPSLTLFQIDDEFYFRPYLMGDKSDRLNVYRVQKSDSSNDLAVMLGNILADVGFQSRSEDLNWF
jgi:hypothetical protein